MFKQDYKDLYKFSISNIERFWDDVAKEVTWSKQYTNVLEDKLLPSPKWFTGGEINMSYNCLDKHIEGGHGDDVAVIHESPAYGIKKNITYFELLQSVELLAGILVDRCEIMRGDMILLYFPMIPECLISMLACTRIGATYACFVGKELSSMIDQVKPKVVITCNVGLSTASSLSYKDKLDAALIMSLWSPKHCIVYNRSTHGRAPMKEEIDLDWNYELSRARRHGPVPVNSNHPMFVIFTSGTTGDPKGLTFSTGGSIVYNKYIINHILGMKAKETLWALSDFAWIVGQSMMSYGPLLARVATILYEGNVRDSSYGSQITRVLSSYNVTVLFCVPRVMALLQKNATKSELELYSTKLNFIAFGGEVFDPVIGDWTSKTFGCPVYNTWGQTELGGLVSSAMYNNEKQSVTDNSALLQAPGIDIKVVDRESGSELPVGTLGRIVIKLPTLPFSAVTIFGNHERFVKTYFDKYPGYYDTMDAGVMDENRCFKVLSRDDDFIDVSGIRVCASSVEEACLRNDNISEAIVLPFEDEIMGTVPFAFLILKSNVQQTVEEIIDSTIENVKDIIGEIICFGRVVIVNEVPVTISGKVHRTSLKDLINFKEVKIPVSVVNEHVYPAIYDAVIKAGFKAMLPTQR